LNQDYKSLKDFCNLTFTKNYEIDKEELKIMKKNLMLFLGGLFIGIILMAIIVWTVMPALMLTIHKSTLNFEQTVSAIQESATQQNWQVPKVYDIQKSLKSAGHEDMTKVTILSLCQPDHAYKILNDDANKKVTAIMPCRLGVYETQDGQVYIAGMNIGLMSKMFGGTIAKVMAEVTKEEHHILQNIIEE
jgi:uncharacterized protein (DUF302 family)